MIRNDTSNDFLPGGGPITSGGNLEDYLRGAYGYITPVYDSHGNLTGYRQGFPGQGPSSGGPGVGGTTPGGNGYMNPNMYGAPSSAGTTPAATTIGTRTAASTLGSEAFRYGLSTGGNILASYLQARAQGQASDAQQKYLEEALAYAKEKDAYDRQVAAEKVRLEASRYGDYSNRIAPYLATGSDANARMANVMGLPSPAPYSANPTGASATTTRITTQPVPSGTTTPPVPPTPPVPNPAIVPRGTSGAPQIPQSAGGMVHMQSPTGSQRLVPADQVQHYLSRGATVVA